MTIPTLPRVLLSAAVAIPLLACEDPKGLVDGLLTLCDESTVYLSQWWSDAPADRAAQITIDPVGGWIFLYWIDTEGLVCHGEPGVSGWPGPVVIPASDPRATTLDPIPEDILAELQEIPFGLAGYQAPGPHLVQFATGTYRARGTGARVNAPPYDFGVAAVAEPQRGSFCLQPWVDYTETGVGCSFGGYFLPNMERPDGQHPNECLHRATPGTGVMSTDQRRQFCVTDLPRGTQLHELRD